jgi:hypothetical protein
MGNVLHGQAGYLMKRDLFGTDNGTLMPYVQAQIAVHLKATNP